MVLDATRFSRRWSWTPPLTDPKVVINGANTLQPVAVSQGQVFASTGSNYLRDRLYALNESDGGVAWQSADLTLVYGQANPPTVVGDRVLVSTSGQAETALSGFDRASGAPLFKTEFLSQWSRYYAPVVVGQQVLNLGGYYGGLLGFDLSTGGPTWANGSYLGYEQSTPAADDRFAYALVGRSCGVCDDAGLGAIDPATGALAWRVAVPGIGYANSSLGSAPVLADGVVYLYDSDSSASSSGRQLVAFSVTQRRVLWQATGTFFASPVVGNGAVYSALGNPERIEARNAADGTLLWTWMVPAAVTVPAGQVPPTQAYAYQGCHACLLLAGNMLFYSASWEVHAIDLTRRTSVWTFPRPGDLSLSANGTLFIASTLGPGLGAWLTAINLR
jgi:outer membrane protein assembly factor BamB